ncbi:serine hydrolase domain-containing protein [Nocardioides panacisoli]|uniref:Serine hydrolase domain-containing protein n=1 Tax=Nocardioides panacisoli TaxID=627624 RepID=A0ABP7IZ61_9ACTN
MLERLHREGREPGGAVCVIRDDVAEETMVGDRGDGTPWTSDTLVMTYSCGKPMAALAVLSAVAEGALGLDQPVAEAWPAYAANGKGATTVRHLLSHQAGLPLYPEAAAALEYDDREALVELLAGAAPVHEPGTRVAEHALTYGHLCDELLRRTAGEPVDERFARIAAANGWDLHLSVPADQLHRVADVVPVDPTWPQHYLQDPRWGPALGRPPGLLDPVVLNSERWRRTSFAAISLHASARGLARLYADLVPADGPVAELLGPDLHAELLRPQRTGVDGVIGREVTWTLAFQRDDLPGGRSEIGMGGAGGCSGWVSVGSDGTPGYAAAYVTRGLGDHDRGDQVWRALEP